MKARRTWRLALFSAGGALIADRIVVARDWATARQLTPRGGYWPVDFLSPLIRCVEVTS